MKSGGGVLTLSQSSTLTGDTRIYGGTLRLTTNGSIGSSTLDYGGYGGSVSFGASTSQTLGGLKGTQDLSLSNDYGAAVALTLGGNGQSTTYSGILSGPGS